ncbi:hypothetical protein DFP72DRAFT_1182048 [Ephemerocybe angulata]|uniref:Uncharacterized protein n=1 Tax=Ephemerocybe angulata TaxID=980116 RepID=A0A8H6H5M2_9AGAR|nr:hypothetical protein DFP72DRAFT_1182048 [Tulosesus angulatus]
MSKQVSIEEPFQLSSYTSSFRGKQKPSSTGHVFARSVNAKSRSTREGLVTVAAQADGIHLVDISSLHSVASHTLGPSTSFSCPAVTLGSDDDEYTTYAVIETSPEMEDADEAGRVVWKWNDSLSSSDQQKTSLVVVPDSERIHGLYAVAGRLLAVTQAARILLLHPTTLQETATLSISPEESLDVYRVFVFSSSECSFTTDATIATVLITSFDASGSLTLNLVSINADNELSPVSQFRVSQKREVVSDISCSPSGCFSVLCKDGGWGSYTLTSLQLRPLSRPFKLANLATEGVTIATLTSYHVLLAALPPSPSSAAIHIQIWDLQYSVLLSSHALPMPSAFSSSTPTLKLEANQGGVRGHAILALSASSGASSLFVIPYLVPQQSTLAVAISRGSATKQWLQTDAVEQADGDRQKVLGDVKTAMGAGKVKVAENAFATWLKAVEGQELEYNFVKELLQVLLPPAGKTVPVHAAAIVKTLLERKGVVSSSMVESGLLRALRERNDWASIQSSFSSVVDLPESDIIETLVALAKIQAKSTLDSVAMQVDSTDVPALSAYLHHCVTYPNITSKGVVMGLKRFVRDPQDAAAIAQVLEGWMRASAQQRKINGEIGLLPTNKDLEKNEHGVWVVRSQKTGAKRNKKVLPPLPSVVSFLQSFMDACFLQLLQHAPSHRLLQQLQAHLVEEAAFSDVLEQLRGALEPFAVGHQKSVKEAAIPEKEKERQRQKGDWRQRRGGAPAVVGAVGAIGVYQVEEMAL